MIDICERFGWTYFEYMCQPNWFIGLIQKKLSMEAEHKNNKK